MSGEGQDGTEFGWKVHAALDSWTGKVDSKASIALAIESAVFGFVISLSKTGERFAGLDGLRLTSYRVGAALMMLAIALAVFVVMPQLRRRQSKQIWHKNMIYFGHLRHWHPPDLAAALREEPPVERQLAQQLVTMSKICWRKHSCLQWSLGLFAVGSLALVAAGQHLV